MHRANGKFLYSPSDLVSFLECEHSTTLDLVNLETPLPKAEISDENALLQEKGLTHERRFLEHLQTQGHSIADLSEIKGMEPKVRQTLAAMAQGVDIIFQGALHSRSLLGYPDFLRRIAKPSRYGDYGYEVLDTKLARSPRAKFVIQLSAYSYCLAQAQGSEPTMMHVVLGDQSELHYRYSEYARYVNHLRTQFEARLATAKSSYPDPCEYCDFCRWQDLCEERRVADDHLCQVANITKIQTRRLQAAGIPTLAALGRLDPAERVPKISAETLGKIRDQARLQLEARESGKRVFALLPGGEGRGFARLPKPDRGDLFFDMEGNPYEEGGLEYLFGVYFLEAGEYTFRPYWAHTRAEEKTAFEQFMDFVTARIARYPGAHVYHYAHYEPTALKRLMSLHGTREAEVDNLLRRKKFVDLYAVVREGLRVSEPSYSIKNIEHFYLEGRTAEVKSAGASIVFYERWKATGDPQLLNDIQTYNLDDVRSTQKLQQWLVSLKPGSIPWFQGPAMEAEDPVAAGTLTAAEQRLLPYRRSLVDNLPPDRETWSTVNHVRELTFFLLDFHRRANKPVYWKMFARQEMSEEDLIEDAECLAGLRRIGQPVRDGRSLVWSYQYPPQETKLRTGSEVTLVSTTDSLGKLELDPDARIARLKPPARLNPLPDTLSLGPGKPINVKVIQEALFRFADSLIDGSGAYSACESILSRALPSLADLPQGDPILAAGSTTQDICTAIARLQDSYLFIQGPPGAGKTYTGSHAIVDLIRRGFRVGVTSNSHKAINNLLHAVEQVAKEQGVSFKGIKKNTDDDDCLNGIQIEDTDSNDAIEGGDHDLIAGTAWLFSRPSLDQEIDFLFIDEAGQVSLANVIAMGTSARNIVLLGDQMQLGQPIQGVHPGSSGDSILEYLLESQSTIAPNRGVFLETTRRMHPDVCQFISDAVYDGRLRPESETQRQVLVLDNHADPALKKSGIRFVEAEHDGCRQTSPEEAEIVRRLFTNLMSQRFVDNKGVAHPFTPNNVLVVAPYNAQVNLLAQVLPAGARVGTVDKIQGQEAEVVIASMTTSSAEYMPRHMEFLFSRNRLNVAISRARSLAIVIASPDLLSIKCRSPEDMSLVNTLCWARDYSAQN